MVVPRLCNPNLKRQGFFYALASGSILCAILLFTMHNNHNIFEFMKSGPSSLRMIKESRPETQQPGFYLISMEAAQDMVPALATCGITVYADLAYQALLRHPARRANLDDDTTLIVMPPFAAWETNWPVYKGGQRNFVREGEYCGSKVYEAARLLSRHAAVWACGGDDVRQHSTDAYRADSCQAPKVLVMDAMPSYDFIPDYAHSDPGIIWAKLNLLEPYWRAQDISMPPPLHNGERFRGSNVSDSPAATLPPHLPAPKYFLTFKGNFASHPVRRRFAELHDPAAGIIILDSTSAEASAYDYYDLMFNTTFALVPRGDVEFSYRFAEAVCSGSIPVLIADGWVPPFSGLDNVDSSIVTRFEEYGLEFAEDVALETVVLALKGVQEDRLESMRRKAKETCERHMQPVDVSIDTMVRLALGH